MQAEIITAQTQKQERQAQIEPLKERVAEVLAQEEGARKQIAQTQLECIGLMSEEVETQTINTIKEKTAQALTKAIELQEKFQTITKEIEEAQRKQVTQEESHVSVGGLLAPGRRGKKNDRGKESVQKTKVTTRKITTHMHVRKHAQRKVTTRGRTTRVWEKDLT